MSMDKPYYNPEIWGGIECTINRVRDKYFDQAEYAGHYTRITDIDIIASLGIKKIRYPILWEKHQLHKNIPINWQWTQDQLENLREKKIEIIAGLVHHGSGPVFTDLTDPSFPYLLAAYAKNVARQFPWIKYYTPVNEPLTTARFSGLYGLWYPHKRNTKSFVQILLNELKGIVLSMQEIRKINPDAQLIQTEDLGKTYSTKKLKYQAAFENERRWLTYDILCGKFDEKHKLWKHFKRLNIPETDLKFFLENPCVPDVFGFNHYLTSERYLDERLHLYPEHTHGGNGRHRYADVETVRVEIEENTGVEVLLKEAWNRYKKPVAITEVHLHCHREEQLRWFKHVLDAGKKLVSLGIDVRGVTTWAVLGSYGWNQLLTKPRGDYEAGAFDLRSGNPRATALAHFIKKLNKENGASHHLSDEKGWWQRNSRILYAPVIKQVRMNKIKDAVPILIMGKKGTLGKAFARVCEERCLSYKLVSRQECDISELSEIENAINLYKPWAIINAAGYVRVDDAEKDSLNCFRDNTTGPKNLAIACTKYGVKLISFSSDLVFDGTKNSPYIESDAVNPLNIYGKSKAHAEGILMQENPAALLIRTSAFFSPWDEYNFVHHIRKSLSQYESIDVAKDITVSPTYVPDLVNAALDILIDEETGIWHLANKGSITWADLAYDIADGFDLDRSFINAVSSGELNYAALRPAYSVLSTEKGHLLPSFQNAFERYVLKEKIEARKKVA